MISDYLQPTPPLLPDAHSLAVVTNTGPSVPFLSSDDQGNAVFGSSVIASSFSAPTGAVGFYANPTWTGPTAQVFGSLQAGGIVVGTSATGADPIPTGGLVIAGSQGPGFYATADQAFASLRGGWTSRVYGSLYVDGSIWGPGGQYSTVGPVGSQGNVGSQGPVGSQGNVGSQGPVGSQGVAGTSYTGPTGGTPNLSGYLTTTAAAATYLTQTNAASTYLAQTTAASTYLTQANASTTYLTQTNAASNYLPRPWCCGYVNGTTFQWSLGLYSATVTKGGTGIFVVTFATAPPNSSFLTFATVHGAGYATQTTNAASAVTVSTYNTSGALADLPFFLLVVDQ